MLVLPGDNIGPDELAKDSDILTMGVTPSGMGRLHMGHHLTMYRMLKALASTVSSKGIMMVDDREFGMQGNPSLPNGNSVMELESAMRRLICQVSDYLNCGSLPDRISIIRMSTLFSSAGIDRDFMGHDFLMLLRRLEPSIAEAFRKMRLCDRNSARGLCPSCHQGTGHSASSYLRRDRRVGFEAGKIVEFCGNPDCDVDRYDVFVSDGDDMWTTFYSFVSFLNILISKYGEKSVLEFFGGDYAQPWGMALGEKRLLNRAPKAYRISHVVDSVEQVRDRIHHVVGPLVTVGGMKLSKSEGNFASCVDLDLIESVLSQDLPEFELACAL